MPTASPRPDQVDIAQADMVRWLAFPTELEREPDEIELVQTVEVAVPGGVGDFFVFRFRTNAPHWAADRGWMIGLSGPYPRTPSQKETGRPGWTFSRLERESAMPIAAHVRQLVGTVEAFHTHTSEEVPQQ